MIRRVRHDSYAQNAEGGGVDEGAAPNVANGFYIDIGAWDPVVESVTEAILRCRLDGSKLRTTATPHRMFQHVAAGRIRIFV